MTLPATIPQALAIIVGLIGSATDIKTGKVYNLLTLPAALTGIILCTAMGAMDPFEPMRMAIFAAAQSMGGLLLALVIMMLLQFGLGLRQIGGGDVKLLAALGALIGPALLIATFLYFCVVYSTWTCLAMALAFPWKQLPMAYAAKDLATMNLERFNEARKKPIPMAPFITAGLIIAVLWQEPTLSFMGMAK